MTSSAVLRFGALTPSARPWRSLSPWGWTCVGMLAVPLWATWPALALRALTIPAFECLTIAFAFGWLLLEQLESASPRRASSAAHCAAPRDVRAWIPALACALGLTGSNAFHILATHSLPAAEANLISYLWPVEIIGLGALAGIFRLRWRDAAGLALGFAGAALLLGRGALSVSYSGIALALLSGISWALYCLFRLMWKDAAPRLLPRACALSALLCAVLHLVLEPSVLPDVGALLASAAVGIVPLALGNLAWDQGFRRGDSQLLAVMAYATPLCGALLLVVLRLEQFRPALLGGALLIVLAGLLSHAHRSPAR